LAELKRTTKRIAEQEKGEFDLTAVSMSANKNHVRLDHASFVENTKVASAGNRGRGLFATKDLKRGDLIMVEKAFCVAHKNDAGGTLSMLINTNTDRILFGTHAQRFLTLLDKMAHNPKQASLYLDLFDGGRFATEEVKVVDGKVVIDTVPSSSHRGAQRVRLSRSQVRRRGGGGTCKSETLWKHRHLVACFLLQPLLPS